VAHQADKHVAYIPETYPEGTGAPEKVAGVVQSLLPEELQHSEHIHTAMRCVTRWTTKFSTSSSIDNCNIKEKKKYKNRYKKKQ